MQVTELIRAKFFYQITEIRIQVLFKIWFLKAAKGFLIRMESVKPSQVSVPL